MFVPPVRAEVTEGLEWEQLGVVRLAKLLASFTIGWPLYLCFNVSGRPYPGSFWVNHFNPYSPIFR